MKENQAVREHFKGKLQDDNCILCRGALDENTNDRGIVEFDDGWHWICSSCRPVVGDELDLTQNEYPDRAAVIPYYGKSRKRWLAYLEREFDIKIVQQI